MRKDKVGNELLSRMRSERLFENSDKALKVLWQHLHTISIMLCPMPWCSIGGYMVINSGVFVMHPQWYTGSHLGSFLFSPRVEGLAQRVLKQPCRESQAISGVSNIPRGGGAGGVWLCWHGFYGRRRLVKYY